MERISARSSGLWGQKWNLKKVTVREGLTYKAQLSRDLKRERVSHVGIGRKNTADEKTASVKVRGLQASAVWREQSQPRVGLESRRAFEGQTLQCVAVPGAFIFLCDAGFILYRPLLVKNNAKF